MFLAFCQSSKR